MSGQLIVTALAVVVFYFLYKKISKYRRNWKYAIHIPGPKGVPIVGNIPSLLKGLKNHTMREDRFQDCLKYKSLHKYYGFDKVSFLVYNPEDMEAIMNNMKLITKGEPYETLHDWLGTGLLTSTGKKWQYRRKILTPAFHFSILQDFLIIFNNETDTLVENLKKQANKSVNVIKPITEFTLSSIGETSLGVQINKEPNCKEYKTAIYDFGDLLMAKGFRPWLQWPIVSQLHPFAAKTKKMVEILHDFSTNVIQKRKIQLQSNGSYVMNKRLALLDLLLKARRDEGIDIDDEGIREEVDTFMFEGHDTTAVSLCYTLVVLANEQKIQEEIYQEISDVVGSKKHPDSKDLAEMTYMERCIKESLRLYPSVPNILRKLTEDVKTKDGYTLPEGCDVDLSIFDLHRMPHLWENPMNFDPDRFLPDNVAKRHPFSYVPFSAGPRNCIGQKFAMMELKAAITGVLRAFKLEPVTKYSDIRFKMDMVLRPVGELNVKFVPRK